MEYSLAEQFVVITLHPEKGRQAIGDIQFRYSLTGAFLMEYFTMGEFTIENKRLIGAFSNNGEVVHDLFADKIMASQRNKRISTWISSLTNKSRIIKNEVMKSLEKKGIITIEQKRFLNIIPYKRYWFRESGTRNGIIELLRNILLYEKQPGVKEMMLLGLIEASCSYKMLSRERGEAKLMRKKNKLLLQGDILAKEISETIKQLQAAITSAVMAATMSSAGHH